MMPPPPFGSPVNTREWPVNFAHPEVGPVILVHRPDSWKHLPRAGRIWHILGGNGDPTVRAPEQRFGIILASGIILTPVVVRPAVLGNSRVDFPEGLSRQLPAEVQAYPTPGPGG